MALEFRCFGDDERPGISPLVAVLHSVEGKLARPRSKKAQEGAGRSMIDVQVVICQILETRQMKASRDLSISVRWLGGRWIKGLAC